MKEETRIQIDLVVWLKTHYPNILFTSTQAGDRRSMLGAIMMKRMGYMNGTPDLIFFEPRAGWNGLLLEIKTAKGMASKEQKQFKAHAEANGYRYTIVYGLIEAKEEVASYLANRIDFSTLPIDGA